MHKIEYVMFDEIAPSDFLPLLNSQKVRTHLIEHPVFDLASTSEWMERKIWVDRQDGCRVRAILVSGEVAGWCGIQLENGQYEVAIVLRDDHWGIGRAVFTELLSWARDLGHEAVCIHFLSSRPEYRFLRKVALRVYESTMFGARFTTYEIPVSKPI